MKQNTEIEIAVADLKPVLPGLAKLMSRSSLPILGCIKLSLDADAKVIQLQAHNLDEIATVRLENKAAGLPGELLFPYEMLTKLVKGCSADQSVRFIGSKQETKIRYLVGGSSVDRLVQHIAPVEWPETKAIEQEAIALDDSFKTALREALECASEDASRYVLNGACLDVTDKAAHYVVGTDGRHLYSANSFRFGLPESLIIPTRKFLTWPAFVNDGAWNLRMLPAVRIDPKEKAKEKTDKPDEPSWLRIDSDHWTYVARAIDGKYPSWKVAVPVVHGGWTRLVLAPAGMKVIQEAVPLLPGADLFNRPIKLEVGENQLTLRVNGKDQADETRVPIAEVTTSGNPVEVTINRDYLLKAMRFGFNQLDIKDPLEPVCFSNQGKAMVVMPLRPDPPAREPLPTQDPAATQIPVPAQAGKEQPSAPQNAPAAPPSAAPVDNQTEPERTPMAENAMTPPVRGNLKAHTNGNGEARPAIKAVMEQLDGIKARLRQVLGELNDATAALKATEKEHRTANKEIETVRAKLREIQSVAI